MRKILLALILISSVLSVNSQNYKKLSKQILKSQQKAFIDEGKYMRDTIFKVFENNKNQSKWSKILELNAKNDTIFFIDSYSADGALLLSIWNTQDTLFLKNQNGKLVDNKYPLSKNIIEILSRWDTERIIELEKESDNYIILPRLTNYVTRVIFYNKKYKINCFKYKDFILED